MARGREKGKKNRNYPSRALVDALAVPRVIVEEASGMRVSRLTLAGLLDTTPTSSVFRELVGASRFYGLSQGGVNADEFDVTERGEHAVSADEGLRIPALKAAVLSVPPYKVFFESFRNKKMPSPAPLEEFLKRDAGIQPDAITEVTAFLESDAQTAGLTRIVGNGMWIDLDGAPMPVDDRENDVAEFPTDDPQETEGRVDPSEPEVPQSPPAHATPKRRSNAIFVGHGKNKTPRDQLVRFLNEYKIPHKVAEYEANKGRPIPRKVKDTMEECGAAILIFSADEELFDKDQNSVWRPSENVVNELGAASILYGDRIVIFREESVKLASNYESIGYITFPKDDLASKATDLLRELIAFDILKVSFSDN